MASLSWHGGRLQHIWRPTFSKYANTETGIHFLMISKYKRLQINPSGVETYHQNQIGSINLSHCCHVLPWLCAWSVSNIICCWFHIYNGIAGLCFLFYCVVLWNVQIIEYVMARWSYMFLCTLHYLIIIIMWMYLKVMNACQVHSVECVSKIK